MLPHDSWREHEPRFGFPVFKGLRNLVSFSIRSDFRPLDYGLLRREFRQSLNSGWKFGAGYLRAQLPRFIDARGSNRLRFRLILTTRDGRFLRMQRIPGSYPPGGSVDIDVSRTLRELGLPDDDYMAILVMTNGRMDGNRSSPGSYSMTYVGDRFYTTYRTGGFTRTLNDPRRKKHSGFRGINPKAIATETTLGSLLLINHSSNPDYDRTVRPTSTLLRADGATREADFGEIAPFGAVERSMEDLFGPDVVDFMASFGGRGTTITTCPGVTLASIHLMRARDGSSMSIEHSRPTQTYLFGIP